MAAQSDSQSQLIIGPRGTLRHALLDGLGAAGGTPTVLDPNDDRFAPALASWIRDLGEGTTGAIVVNILDASPAGGLQDMALDAFERLLDTQIASTWRMLSELLQALRGRGGVVVNVMPIVPGALCLAESLAILGRCAAIEGGAPTRPVRVHTITTRPHVRESDVASAAAFLAGDGASYMSGNVLRLGEPA